MSHPFDTRARRTCFSRAVGQFHVHFASIAKEVDAAVYQRGFASVGCRHPKVVEAFRLVNGVADEMLGFEAKAAGHALRHLKVRGVCDPPDVYSEEQEKALIDWVSGELGRAPERILAECRTLIGKPSDLQDLAMMVREEVNYRIQREYRERRAELQLEVETVQRHSHSGTFSRVGHAAKAKRRGQPPPPEYLYKLDGAVYKVRFEGEMGTIDASLKGAGYIFRLLQRPYEPFEAVDLRGGVRQTDSGSAEHRERKESLRKCNERLKEINSELAEAVEKADSLVADELQQERQKILAEVNRLTRKGGRLRRPTSGDPKEAARVSVRQSINLVKKKCAEEYGLRRFAEHLKAIGAIATAYVYQPLIDIGRPSRAVPVTPPGIRVRTTAVRSS